MTDSYRIFDIVQLAHGKQLSPDTAGSEQSFTELLDMEVPERGGQSIYLRTYEKTYHHTLTTTESGEPRLERCSFRARSDDGYLTDEPFFTYATPPLGQPTPVGVRTAG